MIPDSSPPQELAAHRHAAPQRLRTCGGGRDGAAERRTAAGNVRAARGRGGPGSLQSRAAAARPRGSARTPAGSGAAPPQAPSDGAARPLRRASPQLSPGGPAMASGPADVTAAPHPGRERASLSLAPPFLPSRQPLCRRRATPRGKLRPLPRRRPIGAPPPSRSVGESEPAFSAARANCGAAAAPAPLSTRGGGSGGSGGVVLLLAQPGEPP